MKNQIQFIARKGKQEYSIIREFNAPRNLVFKAFSQPELLADWFLPKEANLKIDIMDCRAGGSFNPKSSLENSNDD